MGIENLENLLSNAEKATEEAREEEAKETQDEKDRKTQKAGLKHQEATEDAEKLETLRSEQIRSEDIRKRAEGIKGSLSKEVPEVLAALEAAKKRINEINIEAKELISKNPGALDITHGKALEENDAKTTTEQKISEIHELLPQSKKLHEFLVRANSQLENLKGLRGNSEVVSAEFQGEYQALEIEVEDLEWKIKQIDDRITVIYTHPDVAERIYEESDLENKKRNFREIIGPKIDSIADRIRRYSIERPQIAGQLASCRDFLKKQNQEFRKYLTGELGRLRDIDNETRHSIKEILANPEEYESPTDIKNKLEKLKEKLGRFGHKKEKEALSYLIDETTNSNKSRDIAGLNQTINKIETEAGRINGEVETAEGEFSKILKDHSRELGIEENEISSMLEEVLRDRTRELVREEVQEWGKTGGGFYGQTSHSQAEVDEHTKMRLSQSLDWRKKI